MSALAVSWLLELLREGRAVRFVATGDSMAPAIPSGARVTAEPCDGGSARPGDVALYAVNSHLRVHRVVRLLERDGHPFVQLKGDNLPVADAPVPARAIVGRVVDVQPPGRRERLRAFVRAAARRIVG